jgi:hypothetical protein
MANTPPATANTPDRRIPAVCWPLPAVCWPEPTERTAENRLPGTIRGDTICAMTTHRMPLLPTVAAISAPVQQQPCRPRRSGPFAS